MPSPWNTRPLHRWVTLVLCGVALAGGVAAAAPAAAPSWVAKDASTRRRDTALDLVVDGAGNSFSVFRSGEFDEGKLRVLKYNNAGQRQWAADYAPELNVGFSGAAALDAGGNLIVGTVGIDLEGVQNLLVVKFDADGELVWAFDRAFPAIQGEVFSDLAVDTSGDVYVTGTTLNAQDESADALVLKLDAADGSQLWEAATSGEAGTHQFGYALAVDPAGGVYFTGHQFDNTEIADILTVKLDATNGAEIWSSTFDGPDGLSDFSEAIAVTPTGVAVTGFSESDEGTDFITLKYNAADGQEAWAARFDGDATGEESIDAATALAVDTAGNIYVTGYATTTGASVGDFTTIKYHGDTGSQVWVARYDGPGAEEPFDFFIDIPVSIRVDTAGSVYVTGDVLVGNLRYDIGTVKYNSAGQQQWVHLYNARNLDDFSQASALDGAGNVYVAGTVTTRVSEKLDDDTEVVVLKYLPTGRGSTAVSRIPKPTFTYSESAKDKVVCTRAAGQTTCDEATTLTFKITSTATMQDVDITAFNPETPFKLSVGGREFERTLGDDPRYTLGKTKATFVTNILDADKRTRKALTITLSWPRGKLKVSVVSTAYHGEDILARDYLDEPTSTLTDSTTATVSLGDFTQEFEVAVKGKVTTRPTRDGAFSLSTVTLTGKGTGL